MVEPRLTANGLVTPSFDAKACAAGLERLYRTMAFRHRARRPPIAIGAGEKRSGASRRARAIIRVPQDARLMRMPAASRSKVSGVTPSARSSCFCTLPLEVLGKASTCRT